MYNLVTAQGHKIITRGTYDGIEFNSRIKFVIFFREKLNDYNIALNYNDNDGTWAQGIYDFKSKAEALNHLNKIKKNIFIKL